MNRRSQLPIIAGVLLVTEIVVLFAPLPLRVPAGILLVLVLPGLAATRVLRRRLFLDRVALLVLVPGLSLATSVLVGLLVYAAHLRLTTPIWALALAAVVLVLLAAGGRADPRTDGQRRTPLSGWIRTNAAPIAIILCSLLTIVGAFVLAVHGERSATSRGFTQLWALRTHAGSRPAIALGVTSHERGGAHYRLRIVAGRKVKVLSFELAPHETLRRRLPFGNARDAVTLTLSKLPDQIDYRHLRLARLEADGSQ